MRSWLFCLRDNRTITGIPTYRNFLAEGNAKAYHFHLGFFSLNATGKGGGLRDQIMQLISRILDPGDIRQLGATVIAVITHNYPYTWTLKLQASLQRIFECCPS
jgi:hypothetical protein